MSLLGGPAAGAAIGEEIEADSPTTNDLGMVLTVEWASAGVIFGLASMTKEIKNREVFRQIKSDVEKRDENK